MDGLSAMLTPMHAGTTVNVLLPRKGPAAPAWTPPAAVLAAPRPAPSAGDLQADHRRTLARKQAQSRMDLPALVIQMRS